VAEAEVGLRASLKDRAQTARGLREIDQGVDRVGRSAETAGRRARVGARGFDAMRKSGRLAASGIRVGFAVALTAGYGVIRLLRSSFAEAREAQKVGAITRSTIKSMGAQAAVSARHVERLSGRLSVMAGIDDEIIQGGANVVLRFAQIRNEAGKNNKIFDRATTAATDMAAALAAGKGSDPDVAAASKTVGKALADPVKGITALRKAQIYLTESQQESIKTLVEQGNTLGAQKIILGAVEDRFSGAARRQKTWGDAASVAFHNVEERLGLGVLPLFDRFNKWFATKGSRGLDHYVGIFVHKGVPALEDFTDRAIPLGRRVLPKVANVLGTIKDVLVDAAPYAERLIDAFTGAPGWLKKGLAGGAVAGYLGKKTGVFSALSALGKGGSGILGAVSKAKPLPVYVVNEGFGGSEGGGVAKKVATTAAGGGALAAGVGTAALAALAAGAVYGSYKYFKSGLSPADQRDIDAANKRAALTREHTANIGITEGIDAGVDWNTYLSNAKLAHKYAFDFNTELQHTKTDLDAIAQSKVNPTFGTPGLPDAQRRADVYKGVLSVLGLPVTTHVFADTSSATTSVGHLSQYIHAALAPLVNVNLPSLGGGSSSSSAPPPPPPPPPPQRKAPPVNTPTVPRSSSSAAADKVPVPNLGRHLGGGREVIEWKINRQLLARLVVAGTRAEIADQ
jgi:hypothetical protein